MPIDLEMILTVSPPVYPYNPFIYHFDANENYDHSYKIQEKKVLENNLLSANQQYFDSASSVEQEKSSSLETVEHTSAISTDNNDLVQTKLKVKKKVSFADDKGLALVEVRSIPESPPQPPVWAQGFFSMITKDIEPKVLAEKKWKIAFPNPPYTDLALEKQLADNLVALDSVSVVEGLNDVLSGRVKVKNTSFVKEVFLRITYDRWVSYEDIPATYVEPKDCDKNENNVPVNYDIFQFSTIIQPSAFRYEVVEFCIGYRTNGRECWDNNGSINYRLAATTTGKTYKTSRRVSQILSNKPEPKYNCIKPKYAPIANHFDNTGISSWNGYLNEQPYW